MSKTTDFIINNPGIGFDGSPLNEFDDSDYTPAEAFEPVPAKWQGKTKKDITVIASILLSTVIENGGTIDFAERISAMELFVKTVKESQQFKECVREELAKSSGKLTTSSGAVIKEIEAGVSYDYSLIPQWVELDKAEKEIARKRKALEDKLKPIPSGSLQIDEGTGEILVGPVKTSKSTYSVTLKA